jgi:hypothetical protein
MESRNMEITEYGNLKFNFRVINYVNIDRDP